MAVSESNVTAALQYLAADPHPLAVARYNVTVAENKARETYARLFLGSNAGTNDAKRASAESNSEYAATKQVEAEAILEMERHKSRTKAAEMIIEMYRTEAATARAAERVR